MPATEHTCASRMSRNDGVAHNYRKNIAVAESDQRKLDAIVVKHINVREARAIYCESKLFGSAVIGHTGTVYVCANWHFNYLQKSTCCVGVRLMCAQR